MQPEVRAASLHGYVDLATGLGADAAALVADAGLDIASLATPDRWIPAAGAARLLATTAEATGRADFGLLMSQRRRLSTLGPLSVVLREEPDVRSALGLLLRYERSYNEALHLEVAEAGGLATIRLRFDAGQPVPTEQTLDLATAAVVGILRTFLGDDWQPLSTCFAHPAPADLTTHLGLFGERLRFDHEFAGLVVGSADLDRPNASSDPALRPYTQQLLSTLPSARAESAVDQVRELVELLLPMGRASVDQVARSLGVDRRTLHRHLAGHGETYTSVLHAVRRRLAERYLAQGRQSLTDISGLLGFTAPSSFSRWFREQYGVAPRDWAG
ncbi:AraC-like DNA-binding protein [Nocardioides aromaticivorans]|uniref:AraC-like DNA-binding protein n=1 Tax=Nocardioides aromaticivorans TaxID=200618 RepID=A0A7Z0CLQ7_9ACTN|nr:AraC family transcriptional regulator [Nocardioides aromaticivorans]NYI43020.1 AraC-like DNA-binding protein [Nocardioides aromaticivorans]